MCALKAAKNIGTTQIYVDFDECLDKVFRKNKTNPDETYFLFKGGGHVISVLKKKKNELTIGQRTIMVTPTFVGILQIV